MDVKLTTDDANIIVQQLEKLIEFNSKNKDVIQKFIDSLKYSRFSYNSERSFFRVEITNPVSVDYGTYCRSICNKCNRHTTHTNGICDECKTKLKVGAFTNNGFVAGYTMAPGEDQVPVFTLKEPPKNG